MIYNEGYSFKTKKLARERIERLKEQNQQEILIRKQKIKELSRQTNELRKKIKDKSKTLEKEEEERQATILENRKLKQRIATEKFQRIRDKQSSKGKKTASKSGLKNGVYHVRGHVIEIKDGVRVNSMKKDEVDEERDESPAQNNKSYAPNSYLTNHLSKLINTDLSQVHRQDDELMKLEHHRDIDLTKLEYNRDVELMKLEHHRDVDLTKLEHHQDVDLTKLEHHRDVDLTKLEHHQDVDLTKLEHHQDVDLTKLEHHRDVDLTKLEHHRDVDLTKLEHHRGVDLTKLEHHRGVELTKLEQHRDAEIDRNNFDENNNYDNNNNNYNNNNRTNGENHKVPMIADVLNEIQSDEHFLQRKTSNTDRRGESDLSSIDSLEDMGNDQKILKSSFKSSREGLNESGYRKVTFSDSVEFNTGDVGWLEIQPLERVPLYQQIQRNVRSEVIPAKDYVENIRQEVIPVKNNVDRVKQYTAEETLDRLREEALMSNFSQTSNVSYPTSVSAAMEQLTQSKRIEKQKTSNDKNYELSRITKDDIKNEKDESSSQLSAVYSNKVHQNVDNDDVFEQSKTENLSTTKNDLNRDESHSTGYQFNTDNYVNRSTPFRSASFSNTSRVPTSEYNVTTQRWNSYQSKTSNITSKAETQSEELPSQLAASIYTSHAPLAITHPEHQSKSSHINHEIPKASPVLYVPKYPYFPSKEQRYTKRGNYDGSLPINNTQNKDNYSDETPVSNATSSTVITSVKTCVSTATITTNTDNNERSGRELSLKYINITACDIKRSDVSKPDDIYNELERTLGDISFVKPEKNLVGEKADPPPCTDTDPPACTDNPPPCTDILKEKMKVPDASNKPNTNASNKPNTNAQSNDNKISKAVNNGSGIPVRTHHLVGEASPVRRGRVIVSADKKNRKQIGNMMPRPPVKPKANSNQEKSTKIIVDNKGHAQIDGRTLSSTTNKIPDKNETISKQNKYLENYSKQNKYLENFSKQNNYSENSNNNINSTSGSNSLHRSASYQGICRRISLDTNDNNEIYNKNVAKQTDFSANSPTYLTPNTSNPPRSYARSTSLPWDKTEHKQQQQQQKQQQKQHKQTPEIPLDKTPTDEEINKLWTNVRECIYAEQTEHAYSDSNYIIDNRYRNNQKQFHYRTLSASSLNRRTSEDRPPPRMYTNYTPSGINRRYGSHDSLNQQIVGDRFSPNIYNKPPLLPQRATRIIRNSSTSTENKYTIFKGNDNLNNGHRYRYDMPQGKYVDVTTSMASFLVLEELCKKQNLTPRQAEAVFEASNSIQRKIDKEKAGVSALSMEERRVMESLEKLNDKLKEKGYKAGGNANTSKPPVLEQKRKYPNQ